MSTLGVDRLGEVVEQSASEIYVFAADDFRFILVNRGARENLGYSLAELSEMHPWNLKPEFSEEEFKAFVGPLLSAEVPRLSFENGARPKRRKHLRSLGLAAIDPIPGRVRFLRSDPGHFRIQLDQGPAGCHPEQHQDGHLHDG